MFQIKICGITSADDARDAVRAGVEAVGLNFFPGSPRYLNEVAASSVAMAVPAAVAKVGVFVNSSVPEVLQAFDSLSLDCIQLHGDEPPEIIAHLAPRCVVRAMRMTDEGWTPIVEYLAACRALGYLPAALLIDAHQPGMYGGTGQTLNWNAVRERPLALDGVPIILAGGLTPDNVAVAVAAACPWGVDTASGVESMPGKKHADKMARFVAEARRALRPLTDDLAS